MKPKFLVLIVLIERFGRKFGHHIARQNTAQGCESALSVEVSPAKTSLLKLTIKMLNNIIMQNVVSPLVLLT